MRFIKYFYGDAPSTEECFFLNTPSADNILESVAAGKEPDDTDGVGKLVRIGVIENNGGKLRFCCPIFTREDAACLKRLTVESAARIADKLIANRSGFVRAVAECGTDFSPETHIYLLLCGAVFDGRFFSRLAAAGALAESRPHDDGSDYIPIIYEDDPALSRMSAEILCSYNRLVCTSGTFSSFGDADGVRRDMYRWYRSLLRGDADKMPDLRGLSMPDFRDSLADEYINAVSAGRADPWYTEVFENMGYMRGGVPCVPVYQSGLRESVVASLDALAAETVFSDMITALEKVSSSPELTAVHHGVPAPEIANEVYHLLFGQINEHLVRAGIAASPPYCPGEGRYLRSFEIN